jgi:hypothetical protein
VEREQELAQPSAHLVGRKAREAQAAHDADLRLRELLVLQEAGARAEQARLAGTMDARVGVQQAP